MKRYTLTQIRLNLNVLVIDIPKLSPKHRHLLKEPIASEELLETIKQLNLNKTLGPDGFPPNIIKDFLLPFWNH